MTDAEETKDEIHPDISGVQIGERATNQSVRVLALLLCPPKGLPERYPVTGDPQQNPIPTLSAMRKILAAAGYEGPDPESFWFAADTWNNIQWHENWAPPVDSQPQIARVQALIRRHQINLVVFHGRENHDLFQPQTTEVGAGPFQRLEVPNRDVLALFVPHPRMVKRENTPLRRIAAERTYEAYRLAFMMQRRPFQEMLFAQAGYMHVPPAEIPDEIRFKNGEDQGVANLIESFDGVRVQEKAIVMTQYCQKGGVGKTSATISLAWELAAQGIKVMLVDADPQCSLTRRSLAHSDVAGGREIREVWHDHATYGTIQDDSVLTLATNLLLLKGSIDLALIEREIIRESMMVNSFRTMVDALSIQHRASIVLVDIGPSVGFLNQIVFASIDAFTFVFSPDAWCLHAFQNFHETYTGLWRNEIAGWKRDHASLPQNEPTLVHRICINTMHTQMTRDHESTKASILGVLANYIDEGLVRTFGNQDCVTLNKLSSATLRWEGHSPYPASLLFSSGRRPRDIRVTRGNISMSKLSNIDGSTFQAYFDVAAAVQRFMEAQNAAAGD